MLKPSFSVWSLVAPVSTYIHIYIYIHSNTYLLIFIYFLTIYGPYPFPWYPLSEAPHCGTAMASPRPGLLTLAELPTVCWRCWSDLDRMSMTTTQAWRYRRLWMRKLFENCGCTWCWLYWFSEMMDTSDVLLVCGHVDPAEYLQKSILWNAKRPQHQNPQVNLVGNKKSHPWAAIVLLFILDHFDIFVLPKIDFKCSDYSWTIITCAVAARHHSARKEELPWPIDSSLPRFGGKKTLHKQIPWWFVAEELSFAHVNFAGILAHQLQVARFKTTRTRCGLCTMFSRSSRGRHGRQTQTTSWFLPRFELNVWKNIWQKKSKLDTGTPWHFIHLNR